MGKSSPFESWSLIIQTSLPCVYDLIWSEKEQAFILSVLHPIMQALRRHCPRPTSGQERINPTWDGRCGFGSCLEHIGTSAPYGNHQDGYYEHFRLAVPKLTRVGSEAYAENVNTTLEAIDATAILRAKEVIPLRLIRHLPSQLFLMEKFFGGPEISFELSQHLASIGRIEIPAALAALRSVAKQLKLTYSPSDMICYSVGDGTFELCLSQGGSIAMGCDNHLSVSDFLQRKLGWGVSFHNLDGYSQKLALLAPLAALCSVVRCQNQHLIYHP